MASKIHASAFSTQECAFTNSGKLTDRPRVAKIHGSVRAQAQAVVTSTPHKTLRISKLPDELTTSVITTRHFLIETPLQVPKSQPINLPGKFGKFGGKFVPETLIACLHQLEAEFTKAIHDDDFQEELEEALRDFVGRETPLYHARRLTEFYKSKNGGQGPEIFLKREDLCHGGSHKMNNALAQVMIAKRIGRKLVVTATASGDHGLATASACAKLGLDCKIFMATKDMEQQQPNVQLMNLLGAQVEGVNGQFKDAASEAIRDWVGNMEGSYHLTGTAVGPHPCPTMVRYFQSVIGRETRRQALEKWGGKPDALVACVGTGSNALGLFHEFIGDADVRLVGVEAGGLGLESGRHASTLSKGSVGVYHGAMSYLLQDEYGQTIEPHSIAVGMQYPAVGPELSHLKETGRAEFYSVTDQEALDAYERVCRLEGIWASLEASHALGILEKLIPTLADGAKVVVNCSARGDEDVDTVYKHKQFDGSLKRTTALQAELDHRNQLKPASS
ncbi:tryptophan synthase beta chain 1-like [Prosopis cineraria]|uniref:tryptophan synthase beta chain 1-like n=1 Tax=Prosopis cineraria TaxID=364024 RepID=UPI002410889A|nr:tryptophan synthase beta chain 1-like [Prosopis cineraria]